MMYLNSKHGAVAVYAETIEQNAISQIIGIANSPLGENAHIRIMPDCHAGKGCVVGTTMVVTDKVCPNLVGVDIGCGVDLVKTDINFRDRLEELDNVIRTHVPYGGDVHEKEVPFPKLTELRCWNKLKQSVQETAKRSLGTLGGGNHFIEAYENGGLSVHSGSRNLGKAVAEYYQKLAKKRYKEYVHTVTMKEMQSVEGKEREKWLAKNDQRNPHSLPFIPAEMKIPVDMLYITGQDMQDYLYDIAIVQEFANKNRFTILNNIIKAMGGKITEHIQSIHNYIDLSDKENIILRKGAISAKKDETLVIPINMRDGILICTGKGNPEWNYSAPHGAGRLMSRTKAKENLNMEEYKKAMAGVYTTSVNEATLDEAPMAYKALEDIIDVIRESVDVIDVMKPIYNFKAN